MTDPYVRHINGLPNLPSKLPSRKLPQVWISHQSTIHTWIRHGLIRNSKSMEFLCPSLGDFRAMFDWRGSQSLTGALSSGAYHQPFTFFVVFVFGGV